LRIALRAFVVAAAATLVTLGLLPCAQAESSPVFSVQDVSSYEYYKSCSSSTPYTCSTTSNSLYVPINIDYPRSTPITLGYQLEDITTTAGLDYTGPTSGTVTLNAWQYGMVLTVPIVNDGVAEPTETFRVRLTSSSVGGNISDTGVATILDAGQIPSDCNLSRSDAYTVSLACTGRPANQQWYHRIQCGGWWPNSAFSNGNTVTGNGTSTARCQGSNYVSSSFVLW